MRLRQTTGGRPLRRSFLRFGHRPCRKPSVRETSSNGRRVMNAPAIKSSTGKNCTVDAKPLTKLGSVLTRKQFVTSRLADFADPKKLAVQIGHGPSWWPDVILKELVDNALDAAEGAGVAPEIAITVTGASISVSDNGGGMPTKAVKQILNYVTKASIERRLCQPDARSAGQRPSDTARHAPRADRQARPHCDREPGRSTPHHVRRRPDLARAAPRPSDRSYRRRGRDEGHDLPAGVAEPIRPSFTTPRSLSVAVNPHLTLSFTAPTTSLSFKHKATEPEWTKWKPTDPTSRPLV